MSTLADPRVGVADDQKERVEKERGNRRAGAELQEVAKHLVGPIRQPPRTGGGTRPGAGSSAPLSTGLLVVIERARVRAANRSAVPTLR